MKVSVIVPLYNLADYVTETLSSILLQTHQNWEALIINDASTDNSLEVASEYCKRDSRFTVIDMPKNLGLPAARNAGLYRSVGEFILPLDADDRIDPEYMKKTIPLMTENVGVVATWMEIFGARPEKTGHPGSCYPIFYPTREQILNGNCLPVCSLIRRDACLEVGGWPEAMKEGSEDWALWVRIICQTSWQVAILPEYLFHYRTRPGSMSRQATMMPFEQAREKIRILYGQ